MAYVSQEMKKELSPGIKAVLKKYGMKGSIAVSNRSTLVVNIKQGVLDVIGNANAVAVLKGIEPTERGYETINNYWFDTHYSGTVAEFFGELFEACKGPNYFDDTDSQTDNFHRSHYININIGAWNKPYTVVE
jgi:hypothetical protein